MRIFAIINWWKNRENSVNDDLIGKLNCSADDKIYIFCDEADKDQKEQKENVEYVFVKKDGPGKNRASIKNFVVSFLKEKYGSDEHFAYILEDSLEVKKDPNEFFNAIEDMMKLFSLDLWLNTYTDMMNFVFSKYDPRSEIVIDEKTFGINKRLILANNANPTVMIINTKLVDACEGKLFDDGYEIPMYWILKLLAGRRNNKTHPLAFMNNYFTIPEEIGVFKEKPFETTKFNEKMFLAEKMKFDAENVNMVPDNSLDVILTAIVNQLPKK